MKSSKILSYLSVSAMVAIGQLTVVQAAEENKGSFTSHDYAFVCEASKGGNAEVAFSQVAVTKASDPSVRDFAQKMVADHTKANGELAGLVSQKGASVDPSEKKVDKETEKLQNLSGADFDKAYMKVMLKDHEKTVKLFQKEADKGDDADLKGWVAKTLPTLQEHLSMAQTTEAAVKGK